MADSQFRSLDIAEINPIVRRIWLFTIIIVLFLVAFLFLPWQQTVKGTGTLIAYHPSERVQPVSATINGFIEAFHVEENQQVAKGAKLFTMVDLDTEYAARVKEMERRLRDQLANTRREIEAVKANRDNAVKQRAVGIELYDQRFLQAKERLSSLRLKRTALQKSYETEAANFDRIKRLYEEAIESRRNFERADTAWVKAKTELEKIDVDISVQERTLSMIEQEKVQFVNEADNRIRRLENDVLNAQNRSSGFERDLQRQMTEIARYETSEVRAEKAGEIIRVLTNDKNKFIRQGEPVLQFAPRVSERTVLLKVSDFNMPLIREGLKVRMMFYGWPALQISGWPTIRFGTFGGIIKKVDPVSYEKGYYYAYVVEDPEEPWPSEEMLRRGTQATAWVALDTVPVWYQLWRLMNAFPPKMVIPQEKGE
jgi:membrane fusion protein, adhesin transport system